MQIWFDSSKGSTLILQQSKEQPVLEGRYFFPATASLFFPRRDIFHAATFSTDQQV
jgi:hypothetical protein